jgi:flagellar M-ring protein FliF
VDKTVRYTKQAMGSIRRLSAAVVVNHRKEAGKDGKPVPKALPEAEMKQINDLVREAMGFTKERGDTLSIANAPFTATEKAEAEIPVWKDPENVAFAKELIKYLLIAAIIAYLLIKVVQPILRTMFPPAPTPDEKAAAALAAGLPGVDEGEDLVEIDHYAAKVQKARDIAQNDPNIVANIIKNWMGANA